MNQITELSQASDLLVFSLLMSLSSTIYYFVFFLKFYRILCLSKITFDGLPMLNPYIWPFSLFRILTEPYFAFWSKLLPSVRTGTSSFDISLILALEGLTSLIYGFSQLRFLLLIEASTIFEKGNL